RPLVRCSQLRTVYNRLGTVYWLILHYFQLAHHPPTSTLYPYTTLFRSISDIEVKYDDVEGELVSFRYGALDDAEPHIVERAEARSEEHTSELQSRFDLVCRLLLEKKKIENTID